MQRDFCLGSEWLYYKIYTGVKISDVILLEKLQPVILKLQNKKVIEKWFFIRYKDTDENLRIRFQIKNANDLSKVIQKFHDVFNKLLEENIVWKIQTDIYQREMERYGAKTIVGSEFLFWKDSKMMLQYLLLRKSFLKNETQFLFSFCAIDSFLNTFGLSFSDKLSLLNELQLSFKKEFEADKILKKKLDKSYRLLSSEMKSVLSKDKKDDYSEIFEIIEEKQNEITETVSVIKKELEISLFDFLKSHIHMMVNRQFTSKQRTYELIIYDHLHRYYKTLEYQN